ncbi:15878_t:CDS:2, partial [Entrophospora sp. SA101]
MRSTKDRETIEIPNDSSNKSKEKFTPCVVIDNIDGVIQQCKSNNSMRRLGQLVGAWEVDETAVRNCDDIVNELEVSHGSDQGYKEKVLNYLVPALSVLNKDSPKFPKNIKLEPSKSTQPEHSEEIKVPRLFLIKTILKLAKVNLTDKERASNLTSGEFYDQAKTLALAIWKNKNILSENSDQLSQPESLEKYINAFPSCLTSFFGGMVETINIKKQLRRRNPISDPNNNQTIKTTAFLSSVVITHSFKKRKIWLTQILATLCRRPKLLSSLYQVLLAGGILPHTIRHERRCEKLLSNIMKEQSKWSRTFSNLFESSEFIEEWDKIKNNAFSELLKVHGRDLDFLGDNVSNTRSEKVINSRKESLWLLIDDLYNTFNGTIPLENSLFKDVKEFNDEGLNNIFTCYNKGIQRLYTMLNGEVLQNVTIKGTGMKDISLYKWNDLNKEINEKKKNLKKAKQPKKINPMIIDIEIVNTTIESSSNIPPPSTDLEQPLPTKNTRYRPSQDEKKILENLASFNEMPSMDKIDPVLNSLLLLNPNHWNARK